MTDSESTEALNEIKALDAYQKLMLAKRNGALLLQGIRDRKEAQRERRKVKKRVNDADRARRMRLQKKAARETASARLALAIGLMRESRLDILQAAVRRARGDKCLEQLVGREGDLVMFWQAQEQARRTIAR